MVLWSKSNLMKREKRGRQRSNHILPKRESSDAFLSSGERNEECEPEEDLRCLGTVSNPSERNSSSRLSRICRSISASFATRASNCSLEIGAPSSSRLTHASASAADAAPFPLPPRSLRILRRLSGDACEDGRRSESRGARYRRTSSMRSSSRAQREKSISGRWSITVVTLLRS